MQRARCKIAMKSQRAKTKTNSMKDSYRIDDCIIYLLGPDFMSPDGWLISSMRTMPRSRGKGLASAVLKWVCADADREGVTLYLQAEAEPWDNRMHPGLDQASLVAFYERRGFRQIEGQSDPTYMRR
jgi:GNAT superfamily N-acetyltransferase